MKLSKEFLENKNACPEGVEFLNDKNLLDKDYHEVIKSCIKQGRSEYAGWLLEMKKTAEYVRSNGNIITMKTYQVYNPVTGVHEKHETEELAILALIEVAKQVLEHHKPSVCQEISNENGDTAWTPVDLMHKITVTGI